LLLFITLNLVNDYDTPLVLEFLEKDEDQLLQAFWDLYTDLSAYLPAKIADFAARDGSLTAAQNEAEFHKLTLFRFLLELAGGKRDVRQHKLDLSYPTSYNTSIYGSLFGISGSKRFGTFDSQKMLDALSKSPIFPGDAIRKLDVVKLSAELMSHLPIGFPDGLPFDVLSKLAYGQVQIIRAEMQVPYNKY
jgi:hypothetical protein